VGDLIQFIFIFTFWVSGIIAFLALVYAGFLYIVSGANPAVRSNARKRLGAVFWGMGILLFSVVIVNTINPDIGRLEFVGQKEVDACVGGLITENCITRFYPPTTISYGPAQNLSAQCLVHFDPNALKNREYYKQASGSYFSANLAAKSLVESQKYEEAVNMYCRDIAADILENEEEVDEKNVKFRMGCGTVARCAENDTLPGERDFYLGRNDIRENLDLSSGWFRDILESQPPIPVVGDFIGSISDLSDPLLGIVARTTGMCGDVKEQLDIYFDPEDENATWEPGEWGIVKDILVQRYLIEPGCL